LARWLRRRCDAKSLLTTEDTEDTENSLGALGVSSVVKKNPVDTSDSAGRRPPESTLGLTLGQSRAM